MLIYPATCSRVNFVWIGIGWKWENLMVYVWVTYAKAWGSLKTEHGVFIVSGHQQTLSAPAQPSRTISPAPTMLQLQQGPSPAPHSPAQPQPHNQSQPGHSPSCLHAAGVEGQTLRWQIPWATPTSWGPGNCSTTFLEMFWGRLLVLGSFKVNATLGFLWDPSPGQSSCRRASTSILCHSRVLGWNLPNFTYVSLTLKDTVLESN